MAATAVAVASGHSLCHPPLSPTAAAAAAAATCYRYRRRSLPPPLLTSASANRRRHHRRPLLPPPAMVDPPPPRPPRLVAEALGTGEILAELAAILVAHSQTVRKDGTDLTPETHSGRGIQSFLVQLALGVDLVTGMEQVAVVGVDPDGRVHLIQLLFSVQVNVYLSQICLFDCLVQLTAKGLPPVV